MPQAVWLKPQCITSPDFWPAACSSECDEPTAPAPGVAARVVDQAVQRLLLLVLRSVDVRLSFALRTRRDDAGGRLGGGDAGDQRHPDD